jgi:cell division protein FtsW (lipid II flippase)
MLCAASSVPAAAARADPTTREPQVEGDLAVSASDQQLERKRFMFYQLPYLVLYVAAIGLVAMTAHDAAEMSTYWQLFIPLVALVSILGGWRWAGTSSADRWTYIVRQILHWAVLILVLRLLYAHAVQDFLNDEQSAFVTIYLIGLAAVLSGIYIDWKMALFGTFLLLSGVAIAWLNDNWMILTLVVGIAAVAAIALSLLVRGYLVKPTHTSSAA